MAFDPIVGRHTIDTPEAREEAKSLAQQYAGRGITGADTPSFQAAVGRGDEVHRVETGAFGNSKPSSYVSNAVQVRASDLAPIDENLGVMSTARSEMGRPLSGREVTRDTLVTIHGMKTTVAAAAAMGLVRVNPSSGLYEDATTPQTLTHQEQLEAEYNAAKQAEDGENGGDKGDDHDSIPPFSPDLEQHIADFQQVGDMAVQAGMTEVIPTGSLSANTAAAVASRMGIEPGEVQQRADAVRTAFVQQAKDMTGAGEALPEILQAMQAVDPGAVHDAIREHVAYGRTTAYDGVVSRYILDLPKHDPDGLLAHPEAKALGVRREQNGAITIAHPAAGRVEWGVAIRAGLITPTFKRK